MRRCWREFEGRQHGTSRMILLPNGGTKHGGKILASDVHDRAVVTTYDLLSRLEKRLHEAMHGLWATVDGQPGGIRHSTAEDGHQFVFLIQGSSVGGGAASGAGWAGGDADRQCLWWGRAGTVVC